MVLYAAATWAVQDSPAGRELLANLLYPLPLVAAVALAVRAARAVSVRRAFWTLLTVILLAMLVAEVVWAAWDVGGRAGPQPYVADALWTLSSVLGPVAALLAFRDTSAERQQRAVLDAVVFGVAAGALVWRLLVRDRWPVDGSAVLPLLYPVFQAITLGVLVTAGLAGHRRVPPSVGLFVLAFLAAGAGDLATVALGSADQYVAGGWLDLTWQAQFVLLAVAAVLAVDAGEDEPQVRLFEIDAGLVLVLAGAALALALAAVDLDDARAGGGGPFLGLGLVAAVFVAIALRLVLTVHDLRRVARELDTALAEQRRLAITDALTGLYNRRFFDEMLLLETGRAHRQRTPLAVLLIDLDRFKDINDENGHDAGDRVLAAVAQQLRGLLRHTDVLARHGGEEFVALLPGTEVGAAAEVAERARLAVSSAAVPAPRTGKPLRITTSIGVAGLPADAGPADLLHRADQALYAAKAAGRDRIEVAGRSESVVDGRP